MDSRKRFQKSRTPGLSSIPLVGTLFNNTNKTDSARQVAVFITARLMPETGRTQQKSIEEQAPIKLAGNEFKRSLQKALIDIKRENSGI
jgi:type II secretory pathway component GspD/PulD (secretin)